MSMTPADIADFISDLDAAIGREEQRLNAADAMLGDGDTGSMLNRLIKAMAAARVETALGLSDAVLQLAQASMKETGSSLGTLVATAAMTFAKEAKAAGDKLGAEDMGRVVAAMRDAVSARGKAAPGDKTVVDSLTAIARALDEGPPTRATAAAAAWSALDDIRDRPCRIGRARMFAERSKGGDDPGMLAVAVLLDNKETVHDD